MNGQALLKHYEQAIEDAIVFITKVQEKAEESNDMKGVVAAMKVLNKLERMKEIAELVGDDADFRQPTLAPAERRSDPVETAPGNREPVFQDGEAVPQQARPEDFRVGPEGQPPRLGSGVKKFGRRV